MTPSRVPLKSLFVRVKPTTVRLSLPPATGSHGEVTRPGAISTALTWPPTWRRVQPQLVKTLPRSTCPSKGLYAQRPAKHWLCQPAMQKGLDM